MELPPLEVRCFAPLLLFLVVCIFEYTCLDDVIQLCHTEQGRKLYRQAIVANLINIGLFGPLTYYVAASYCCSHNNTEGTIQNINMMETIQGAIGIILLEGIMYYGIHRSFHEIKGLYWVHSFHHKFNDIILPSTANAVSVFEFVFAYMFPLCVSSAVMQASELSAVLGSTVIGLSNLCIHTSWLQTDPNKQHGAFWMFVSANDHFNHHRQWQGNYGAPVISVDRILQFLKIEKKENSE